MPAELLSIRDLSFEWPSTGFKLDVPHFGLERGQHTLLTAPSGGGKSTFLSLIAGLIAAKSGSLKLANTEMLHLSQAAKDKMRAETIGFIFQSLNLLPYLSAADNILLPLRFSKSRRANVGMHQTKLVTEMLNRIGLPAQSYAHLKASNLSLGQQQRVAALRALIGSPPLLIADEPTSALDADAREQFLELLFKEAETGGTTVLMVSHDRELARHFPRQVTLSEIAKVEHR